MIAFKIIYYEIAKTIENLYLVIYYKYIFLKVNSHSKKLKAKPFGFITKLLYIILSLWF